MILLLLFINYNTDNNEIKGGGITNTPYILENMNKQERSILAIIDDMDIRNINISNIPSIAEFSILYSKKYNIFTYFDLLLNNDNNTYIHMDRYDHNNKFIKTYEIFSSKEKQYRYKVSHFITDLQLDKGNILKFVIPPTSSVIFYQAPLIIIASNKNDISTFFKNKKVEKYNLINPI